MKNNIIDLITHSINAASPVPTARDRSLFLMLLHPKLPQCLPTASEDEVSLNVSESNLSVLNASSMLHDTLISVFSGQGDASYPDLAQLSQDFLNIQRSALGRAFWGFLALILGFIYGPVWILADSLRLMHNAWRYRNLTEGLSFRQQWALVTFSVIKLLCAPVHGAYCAFSLRHCRGMSVFNPHMHHAHIMLQDILWVSTMKPGLVRNKAALLYVSNAHNRSYCFLSMTLCLLLCLTLSVLLVPSLSGLFFGTVLPYITAMSLYDLGVLFSAFALGVAVLARLCHTGKAFHDAYTPNLTLPQSQGTFFTSEEMDNQPLNTPRFGASTVYTRHTTESNSAPGNGSS